MQREFQQGYLELDVPSPRFYSPWKLLRESAQVYFANFGFLAWLTLIVFLPAKLALQLVSYWFDVPKGGLAAYLTMDLSDLVLSALAVPAAVCGLLERQRTGKTAALGRALGWGRRQWAKTLWNQIKVEITITLWSAVFVIPGVVAMVRLIFTDTVIAIEADRESAPLERSRAIGRGQGWRIFAVLAPLMIVEFSGPFLILDAIGGAAAPRALIALVDSLLSVCGQWATVIVLLMYLGLVPAVEPAAAPERGRKRRRHNS